MNFPALLVGIRVECPKKHLPSKLPGSLQKQSNKYYIHSYINILDNKDKNV